MVLTLKSAPQRLIVLEQVRVQFLGEVPFLTGVRTTGLAADENWLKGVPVWYPLRDMMQMAEFETYEDLKRAEIFQKVLLESLAPPYVPTTPKSQDTDQITTPRAPAGKRGP